jgi:hypothetical protein
MDLLHKLHGPDQWWFAPSPIGRPTCRLTLAEGKWASLELNIYCDHDILRSCQRSSQSARIAMPKHSKTGKAKAALLRQTSARRRGNVPASWTRSRRPSHSRITSKSRRGPRTNAFVFAMAHAAISEPAPAHNCGDPGVRYCIAGYSYPGLWRLRTRTGSRSLFFCRFASAVRSSPKRAMSTPHTG